MIYFLAAATDQAVDPNAGGGMWTMLLMVGVMFALMYFFVMRPQNKKRKAEEEMRKSLEVGDSIVTIGGIMGRVVSIKEDTDSIIIETGADRSKVHIKKWAIASSDMQKEDGK